MRDPSNVEVTTRTYIDVYIDVLYDIHE
jgi:hypothetical protein